MRSVASERAAQVRAAEAARAIAEERYLDGHPALFPAAVQEWQEVAQATTVMAGFMERGAELDGLPPAAPPDPDDHASRVAAALAGLVEPAKSNAHDKLGDGERAADIAAAWLIAKRKALAAASGSAT